MSRDKIVLDLSENGPVCAHCGTPNPDHGDKCGNCEEDPFLHNTKTTENKQEELLTFNPKQQKFFVAIS
ncbi:MAG TPA: hypothetical protein P5089_00190 [Candidatus Portnoybacteria bacterium]|nr:hypothetical protein [Candidatus Portnoybacteria bacterium]